MLPQGLCCVHMLLPSLPTHMFCYKAYMHIPGTLLFFSHHSSLPYPSSTTSPPHPQMFLFFEFHYLHIMAHVHNSPFSKYPFSAPSPPHYSFFTHYHTNLVQHHQEGPKCHIMASYVDWKLVKSGKAGRYE